jgi:hypothetical protein
MLTGLIINRCFWYQVSAELSGHSPANIFKDRNTIYLMADFRSMEINIIFPGNKFANIILILIMV